MGTQAKTAPFEHWALVEIFTGGRVPREHWGRISQAMVCDIRMLRIDRPTSDPSLWDTVYYNQHAVISIIDCDEEECREQESATLPDEPVSP